MMSAKTNVPDAIRAIWTDLYKLFDTHYLMSNTEADWMLFWKEAEQVWLKYGKSDRVMDGINLVSEMIRDKFIAEEEKAKEVNF